MTIIYVPSYVRKNLPSFVRPFIFVRYHIIMYDFEIIINTVSYLRFVRYDGIYMNLIDRGSIAEDNESSSEEQRTARLAESS